MNQLDDARAERDRKAAELTARASNEAKIIDGTRWLGLAMIPGGIACAIFLSRKLGIWIAAAGAMCLALGILLGRMAPWVEWASAGGISLAFLYGIGSAFTSLWFRWKTDQQAQGMRALAESTRDPNERAILTAQAAVLDHVGTTNYTPNAVLPSPSAMKLLEESK